MRLAPLAAVAFLTLLPSFAVPGPALAASDRPGADDLEGDEWAVNLTGTYLVHHSTPVLLTATWRVWSGWPIPYAGYEDRLTHLVLQQDLSPLRNATVRFLLVGDIPNLTFRVTFTADDVSWVVLWTWDEWNGCTLDKVVGTTRDAGTTLHGAPAEPLPILGGTVGVGYADKIGPGPDRQYECRGGYPL